MKQAINMNSPKKHDRDESKSSSNTIYYLHSNEYRQQIKQVMTKEWWDLGRVHCQGDDKQIHQPNELLLYLTLMAHSMPQKLIHRHANESLVLNKCKTTYGYTH
mgnify:FL=1